MFYPFLLLSIWEEYIVEQLFAALPKMITDIVQLTMDESKKINSPHILFKLKLEQQLQDLYESMGKFLGKKPSKTSYAIYPQACKYIYKVYIHYFTKEIRKAVDHISILDYKQVDASNIANLLWNYPRIKNLKTLMMKKINEKMDQDSEQAIQKWIDFVQKKNESTEKDELFFKYAEESYHVKAQGAYDCMEFLKLNMLSNSQYEEHLYTFMDELNTIGPQPND